MENHFEVGLDSLRQKLLLMASHAETSVNQSVQALMQRDHDLALRVKADDQVIDDFEVEIDELAIMLLTKAPLASNLRLVTVAMKISQNLERVGDEAASIAHRALDLGREPPLKPYVDIPRMATMSLEMLRDAISAFVDRQPAKARDVVPRDHEVDDLNRQLYRELSSYMIERPSNISRCLALMAVSKRLERIADHATNIAEEVVYLYEARDIRHAGLKTE